MGAAESGANGVETPIATVVGGEGVEPRMAVLKIGDGGFDVVAIDGVPGPFAGAPVTLGGQSAADRARGREREVQPAADPDDWRIKKHLGPVDDTLQGGMAAADDEHDAFPFHVHGQRLFQCPTAEEHVSGDGAQAGHAWGR